MAIHDTGQLQQGQICKAEAVKTDGRQQDPLSRLTVLVKDLGTSLEPDWLLEGDSVLGQQLRGEAP